MCGALTTKPDFTGGLSEKAHTHVPSVDHIFLLDHSSLTQFTAENSAFFGSYSSSQAVTTALHDFQRTCKCARRVRADFDFFAKMIFEPGAM